MERPLYLEFILKKKIASTTGTMPPRARDKHPALKASKKMSSKGAYINISGPGPQDTRALSVSHLSPFLESFSNNRYSFLKKGVIKN